MVLIDSKERHELRYIRRKAKREEKKEEYRKLYDDYEKVFSYENLWASYKKCIKGVKWKASVQGFISEAPYNIYKLYTKLKDGSYKSSGYIEFDIHERGKIRHIKSVHISERIVQRCLCDNCLLPLLGRSFIYDNGASLPGKGYTFAVNRVEKMLHEHFTKYGTDGYVLRFDYSKYFDNIPHELCFQLIDKSVKDERLRKIAHHFIEMYGGDTGIGLGSQTSQMIALAAADSIDHLITNKLGIGSYERYMDDGIIISNSKERLREILAAISKESAAKGLKLNKKKTQIIKLSHGFSFLKVRFYLDCTGRIIKKPPRASAVRIRRRWKKIERLISKKTIPPETARNSKASWDGYAKQFDAWKLRQQMDKIYEKIFIEDWRNNYVLQSHS